jgi:PTS system mannose-specific IIB component
MVIDDLAAVNDIQKTALKMACPAGVKLSVLTVEKACGRFNDPNEHRYDADRMLIIFKDTTSLRNAVDAGLPCQEVNIGNISGKAGSVLLKKNLAITPTDAENIHYLAEQKNIKLYGQQLPEDDQYNINEAIHKINL